MIYAILKPDVYGRFKNLWKDRGRKVSTAAGGKHFPGYSQKSKAQDDSYLFARLNEAQVKSTRRRKQGRVYPSTFTVVEITPEFLSALNEQSAAARNPPARPTTLNCHVLGTAALTRKP